MSKTNILHITDLHFGAEKSMKSTEYAQRVNVIQDLINYLVNDVEKDLKPNIVVISGDIGWSGSSDDYEIAKLWLTTLIEKLELKKENVIVCCGNHDIDRNEAEMTVVPNNSMESDLYLSVEKMNHFEKHFDEFSKFCNDFGLIPYELDSYSNYLVGYRDIFNIRFVVLNSAWFYRKNNFENMWIGKPHLDVMRSREQLRCSDKWTIAVLHHPPESLHESEVNAQNNRVNTYSYLAENVDVILSGHTHQPAVLAPDIKYSHSPLITGGATYSSSNYKNNFSILQVNHDNNQMVRHSYEFNPSKGKWKVDGKSIVSVPHKLSKKKQNQITDLKVNTEMMNDLISRLPGYEHVLIRNNIDLDYFRGMPLLPLGISTRTDNISEEELVLETSLVLNYFGEVWTGKSTFVNLLLRGVENSVLWYRMKNISSTQKYSLLLEIISSLENIEDKTILVLDDIEIYSVEDIAYELLIKLIKKCESLGLRLILTSRTSLKKIICKYIRKDKISDREVPRLNVKEIMEIFHSKDAPEQYINEKFAEFLNTITNGHPALVIAICEHLENGDWLFKENGIFEVIDGDYYSLINSEITEILMSTITDPLDRDLIYRISEIGWSLSEKEICLLCEVHPEINHPVERISKLLGRWVTKSQVGLYSTTPLLKKVAKSNLNTGTLKGIHYSMAKNILKKESIDPIEGVRAIMHFTVAEEYTQAGMLLINLLNEMNSQNIYDDKWLISSLWCDIKLPKLMPLEIKIPLRATQIVYSSKVGKKYEFLLKDFEELSSNCPTYMKAFKYYVGITVMIDYPIRATTLIKDSTNAISDFMSHVSNTGGDISEVADAEFTELVLERGLLLSAAKIKTTNELEEWINILSQLSKIELEKTFSGEDEELYLMVPTGVWLNEYNKSHDEQDWKSIDEVLDKLASFAKDNMIEVLWACAIRIKIITLAEHLDSIEEAILLGEKSLSEASNSNAVFLIGDILARKYLDASNNEMAIEIFERIIGLLVDYYDIDLIQTHIYYSKAIASIDPEKSLLLSKKSLIICQKVDNIDKTYYVKILIEHLIVLHEFGQYEDMIACIENIVNTIILAKNDTQDWIEVIILGTHVLGYYIPQLIGGDSPEYTGSGEEYAIPTRGIAFTKRPPEFYEFYHVSKFVLLHALLVRLYKGLSMQIKLEKWLYKLNECSIISETEFILTLFENEMFNFMFKNGDYGLAFNAINRINVSISLLITKTGFSLDMLSIDMNEIDEKKALESQCNSAYILGSLLLLKLNRNYYINEDTGTIELYKSIDLLKKDVICNNCKYIDDLIGLLALVGDKSNESKIIEYISQVQSEHTDGLLCLSNLSIMIWSNTKSRVGILLKTMPYLYNLLLNNRVDISLLNSLLKDFWLLVLEREGFKYGVSWKVKHKLDIIDIYSGKKGLMQILGVISTFLCVEIPDAVLDWFDE